MMSRDLSKAAFWGGIGIVFLVLMGCKSAPPPDDDVFVLIDRKEGAKAQAMFRGKVDINVVDNRGRTPLHAVADSPDDALAAFLIALGAGSKINVADKQNRTPLGISAEKHDAILARIFAEAGGDIHKTMPSGRSPAMIAVAASDTISRNMLAAILTDKTVLSTDEGGQTILHLAVEAGNLQAVKTIFDKNGAILMTRDQGRKSALDLALEETGSLIHAEIAEFLIQEGARADSPLYDCFSAGVLRNNYNVRLSDGGTPLHYTSREAHTGYIEFLLEHEAEVNAKDLSGTTPLHEAVRSGNTDAVELLVNNGADLDAQDAKGNTPLHIAVPPAAHAQILEILLSKGANPNIRDEHGESPLHIAVILNRPPEVIGILTNRGANVSSRNIDGKTPLYLAVEENRAGLIPVLLGQRSDIFAADTKGVTPLEKAIQDSRDDPDKKILFALLTAETVVLNDSLGNTPLHIAIKKGADADTIRYILDRKALVDTRNQEGNTALHLAVQQNSREAGEVLLSREANIFVSNAKGESPLSLGLPLSGSPRRWLFNRRTLSARDGLGNTALHYAAQWKRDTQIRWMVEEGAAPDAANATGETPLFMAAKADSPSTIHSLLNAGASLGARDKLGNTALHAAVRWDAKPAAETLLIEGLDPNSRALNGRAPLHDAVQLGYRDIEKILINHRANIEIRDNDGNTPLMEAVRGRSASSAETVERLIDEYHAEPLTSNVKGDTPLHIAVSTEQEEVIAVLLNRGAAIHIRNALGRSPFQMALTRPNPETASRLVSLLLIREGVHTPDDKGSSPLHIAIAEGASHQMIRQIIDQGGRLSAIDADGYTPLRLAINRNDWVLAKLLAEEGSDVFFSAGDGKNPAEIAINQGGEALEALFSRSTINTQDSAGNTILHYAARQADADLIRRLISQGAKKELKNITAESPVDIARRWRRDREVLSLLDLPE